MEQTTALRPEPQPLVLPMLFSLFAHTSVVFVVLVGSFVLDRCGPSAPVIDVDKSIEVSMVVLPKSETAMPNRASRRPVPKAAEPAPEAAPAPIRESELAVQQPKAEPKNGAPVDRSPDRKAVLDDLMRKDLLDNLDAPIGTVDQNATDPNSDATEAINAAGAGNAGDPEYARYISQLQALFEAPFKPLKSVVEANPDLVAVVHFTVDPKTGKIQSYSLSQSSGNPSFDASAQTAAGAVSKVPLPPERYRALMADGYDMEYRATR